MKKLFCICSLFLFLCLCPLTLSAEEVKPSVNEEKTELCPNARSAVLFEGKTDQILYQKEMNLRLPPASMTKIMTLLLIYEALDRENISKQTVVTVSEYAKSMEGSKAFLSVGEQITVDELLKCISIASANDAAVAMAELISGSEAAFVDQMNARVEQFGLKNTHFSDCTGLSSRNHYTSAYDLAVISDYLIDHYPDVLTYTSMKEDYIRQSTDRPFWLVNTNKLLGRVEGINGLKTGYTSFSGYCITLHMEQNEMGLISVVMGYRDSKIRNGESVQMLRYGATHYQIQTVIEKNQRIDTIDSVFYKDPLKIVAREGFYVLTEKGKTLDFTQKTEYRYENGFTGKMIFYKDGEVYREIALEAEGTLRKRNLWELTFYVIKKCLG